MENWISAFKDGVHGAFIVASDSPETIESTYEEIRKTLGFTSGRPAIRDVFRADGAVRPGDQAGHEQYVNQYFHIERRLTSAHCAALASRTVYLTLPLTVSTMLLVTFQDEKALGPVFS